MGRQDRMAEEDETEAMKVPVSAGPCSLLAWPLGNLTSLITGVPNLPANTQFRPPPAKPFGDLLDHLRTCLGSIRSYLVAYVIVFYIHGDDYPAFGAATTLSWSWMWPLLVRNILSAWAVCGFWDWLMYLSPLAARFKPFKINPKLPTWSQVRHDAFWTTIGMVCATLLEVSYCRGVANGKIRAASSLEAQLASWTRSGPAPVQAHPQAAPQELQHDRLLWHQLPPDREHHLLVRWLPRRALRSPPCNLRRPYG